MRHNFPLYAYRVLVGITTQGLTQILVLLHEISYTIMSNQCRRISGPLTIASRYTIHCVFIAIGLPEHWNIAY